MACSSSTTAFAIRNVSRSITISFGSASSCPILITIRNNSCVAQGKSLSRHVQHQSPVFCRPPPPPPPSTQFSQPTQSRQFSTFNIYSSTRTGGSLSSFFASGWSTPVKLVQRRSLHRGNNSASLFKSKMAVASLVRPGKSYSSVVLQPQIDALDESVDPFQRQLLEEQCIVLDDKDQVIGHDTKRNCHRIVNGDVLLHRAFSVFLFNGKGELLLQQRSKTKITFPMLWTNTCCSHPLYTPSELEEKEAIGVRRAARRRLEIELGIPQDSIGLDEFQYLTRIHYKALSNSIWGEHEIDYILFLQKDDLEINPNPEEIQDIRWVTIENVKDMVGKDNVGLTPWFELILNSRLPVWWNNLKSLKQFEDHEKIHRLN